MSFTRVSFNQWSDCTEPLLFSCDKMIPVYMALWGSEVELILMGLLIKSNPRPSLGCNHKKVTPCCLRMNSHTNTTIAHLSARHRERRGRKQDCLSRPQAISFNSGKILLDYAEIIAYKLLLIYSYVPAAERPMIYPDRYPISRITPQLTSLAIGGVTIAV